MSVESKTWSASDKAKQFIKDTICIDFFASPFGAGWTEDNELHDYISRAMETGITGASMTIAETDNTWEKFLTSHRKWRNTFLQYPDRYVFVHSVRDIEYDLLPQTQTKSDFVDPFAQLTPEQLEDLAILSRIRWLIASNKAEPNGVSAQEAKQIEETFAQEGIDVEWLLSKRQTIRQQRIGQTTNKTINGKDIKLSGVILPLYWNDRGLLTHFLLMPYLGQCSHFPPPPPNQVIYVESTEPVDIQQLTANRKKSEYSFLWVSIEGKISLEATSHNVFRVDGMSWLESSYGVICHKISLCTPRDIAQVLAWHTREERKSLYPKLTELISINTGSKAFSNQ